MYFVDTTLVEFDVPLQELYRFAGDPHPLASILAPQFASARRNLACVELGLPQALGPIGSQGAVRRAGHRVFRNPFRRREETGDEVTVRSRRGHDHREG